MLKSLYDFAMDRGLAIPAGFRKTTPKAYISITRDGEFVSIDPASVEGIFPDTGSNLSCQILLEKRFITVQEKGENEGRMAEKKRTIYREAIEDGAKHCMSLKPIQVALSTPSTLKSIQSALTEAKIKEKDTVSWKIDGQPICQFYDDWKDWWLSYRKILRGEDTSQTVQPYARCLITGELCVPVRTAGKVTKGFQVIDGQSSGVALISFDKSAFCSYGLKQALNAPVSAEAMAAVNSALNYLAPRAPVIAGTKLCTWVVGTANDVFDPLALLGFKSNANLSEEEKAEADAEAIRVLDSYRTGNIGGTSLYDYCILQLGVTGSRISVRKFERRKLRDIQQNILAWFDDLSLEDSFGNGMATNPKIYQILYRMLTPCKSTKPFLQRCSSELSALSPALVDSIFNNTPLPETAASYILRYVRSDLLKGEKYVPDTICCQFLKAWLLRKKRGGVSQMENQYAIHRSVAYHCGRAFAIYALLQREVSKSQNTSTIQKFYTACSTTPNLVFGMLHSSAVHQLAKLEPPARTRYERKLSNIFNDIGNESIPTRLTLAQQGEFVLGMQQECAAFYRKSDKTSVNNTSEETVA